QIVLSNFGCGFLSHASAIFSPDALHRTQKSPRLIQKIHYPKFNELIVQNTKFLPCFFDSKPPG
ncbi:MAG TPA: hypothetical protein PKD78_02865, partial [Saprospiraceae bacterium]|nr:hypothetical protein [Saprospiraceae bacterium]